MEHRQNTTNTFGKTFLKAFIDFFEKYYYTCHLLYKRGVGEDIPIILLFFFLSMGIVSIFILIANISVLWIIFDAIIVLAFIIYIPRLLYQKGYAKKIIMKRPLFFSNKTISKAIVIVLLILAFVFMVVCVIIEQRIRYPH